MVGRLPLAGPSATITVHADGTVTTQRNELGGEDGEGEGGQRGAGGAYCKRANVLGMDVWVSGDTALELPQCVGLHCPTWGQ